MKVWYTNIGWRDEDVTGFLQDEDGYCSCLNCQTQKEKEKTMEILVPEELFEL